MRFDSSQLQALGTIAAAIAALIALFVAWDQGRVMRAQQHASVMPILAASVSFDQIDDRVELSVVVRNDGVGPAFVESARILSGGEPMQTMVQFQDTVLPPELHDGFIFNGGTIRGALGAGRQQPMVSFIWTASDERAPAFRALLGQLVSDDTHLQIETCYCSVFGQCWMAQPGESARAQPIRSCPNVGDDVYAQLSSSHISEDAP